MTRKNYTYLSMALILLIAFVPGILLSQVIMDKNGKTPVSIKFSDDKQPTVASFFTDFRNTYSFSEDNQMEVLRVAADKIGTHYRYDQYYKGVKVIGAQYVLHEKNGTVWFANGHLVKGIDVNVIPALREQAALSAALKEVGAKVYMWEKSENEAFLKKEQNNPNATFAPKGELLLTSGRNELTSENIRLVYRFDVYAEQPLERYWVDVDANTGEIVNKISRIHTGDVPGSGDSYYDGNVSMTVDDVGGAGTLFTLNEASTRGAAIHTYNMNNGTNYGAATQFTASTADGTWDAVGVSGHFGAEATYDYYFNEHGRNSLDDAGFDLLSYVHAGVNYYNAFWDGSRMTYGDGNGVTYTPLVSLDVCGHELTHGVTEFTSNLIYANESGGLNESFSDIFGNLVEFSEIGAPGVGSGSWRIGEQITTSGLGIRNMANPNEFNNPDTYLGDFWFYNEVHNTSGVQNFWFYLLVEGGTGTNDVGYSYNVVGIGLDDAGAIAYINNASMLGPYSNYSDARVGSIAAAEALFGVGSQQALSTAAAWDAVNVLPPPPPPENDLCADAIELFCGQTISGTTISAAFDPDAPYCDFAHTAPGVWYTIEGVGADITASMCESPNSYDTRLTVYEGSCESLVCVGADDDGCGVQAGSSTFTWPSTAGTTYYILVHGFGTHVAFNQGIFELSVSCDIPAMISVTPTAFTFTVPLEGSASGTMTIANTGEVYAPDLKWAILQSIPAPVNAMSHSTSIQKNEVNKQFNANNQQFNYIIGQQTIDELTEQGFFNQYPVREQLINLQGQEFSDKTELYSAVSGALGVQNINLVGLIAPYFELNNNSGANKVANKAGHIQNDDLIRNNLLGNESNAYDAIDPSQVSGQVNISLDPNYIPPETNGFLDVLFDNGPLVNSPGTGSGGADESVVQTTLGLRTWGFGNQLVNNNKLAEDFVVSGPLGWQVEEFVFYAYQTDAGNASTITGLYYEIWDGDPNDPSSYPIYGDFSANKLVSSSWTNIYRVLEYKNGNTQRAIMENTASADVFLDPGTYWIVWQTDGSSSFSGPWVPPITINGQGNTGNAKQSINGDPFQNVLDNPSEQPQGLPFMVIGSLAEPPCPWLSFSPSTGTTAQGNSDDVSVMVDAAGMDYGTYECQMTLLSNAGQVIVPVTLNVADMVPPVITVVDPTTLWPPNHKYKSFSIDDLVVSVEDNVDGTIPVSSVVITSVSSDEPDDAPGNGDGNTNNDIVVASDCKTTDLRKERQGSGNGRVYLVNVSVEDAAGNVGTATCIVTVPHDQNTPAVDDGPDHTVYSNCGEAPAKASPVVKVEDNFAGNYEVFNYPNPFKGTTTIEFRLETANYTKLTVYNALGREVATLYDGMTEEDLIYKVEFNSMDLPGGIYFYNLQSGDNINIMEKMMLVK